MNRFGLMASVSSLVVSIVVTGCGNDDGSKRIVDLEKRIATLEGRVATMERQMVTQAKWGPARRVEKPQFGKDSRQLPLTQEQIEERQRIRDDVRKRLEERRDKARAKKQNVEGSKELMKEPPKE